MKKFIWIALIILSIALAQIACKTAAEREAERDQEAAEAAAPAEAAEPAEVVELDADTPGGIFQATMAGVETEVMQFLDGIPVPDSGSVSMEDNARVDFITSMTIEECVEYYRDTFPALGLIEIEELTKISDYGATIIYGGYPHGKAIRVKVSILSDTSRTIQVHILDPSDL